jgi:hypothetical protein
MNNSAMLRKADFHGWVSVVAGFIRLRMTRENGRPLRSAKLYFGKFLAAVFSAAALPVASVGIEDEHGTVFAGRNVIDQRGYVQIWPSVRR